MNDNIEGSKKGVSNRADGLNTDSGGNVESDHEADSGGGDNHGHGKKVPDANSKDKSRMTKVTQGTSIVVSNSGHIVLLDDLVHSLHWCGCINCRHDWIA